MTALEPPEPPRCPPCDSNTHVIPADVEAFPGARWLCDNLTGGCGGYFMGTASERFKWDRDRLVAKAEREGAVEALRRERAERGDDG